MEDRTREREGVELLPDETLAGLRQKWENVQVGFVDEPQRAVEQADELVNETVARVTETFTSERGRLEETWHRGADVTTEDLRIALQRYRSFFNRLLSI